MFRSCSYSSKNELFSRSVLRHSSRSGELVRMVDLVLPSPETEIHEEVCPGRPGPQRVGVVRSAGFLAGMVDTGRSFTLARRH